MDQCISQSSISPSSYSLSPTSIPFNVQHHPTNSTNNNNNNPNLNNLNMIYLNRSSSHQIIDTNLIQQNHYSSNLNAFNDTSFNFDNFNTDLGIGNDDSCGTSGLGFASSHSDDFNTLSSNLIGANTGDNSASNVHISIDLESLLVNTTLSDSNTNILISDSALCDSSNNDPHLNNNSNNNSALNSNLIDDENCSNNINPMFLFKNPNQQSRNDMSDLNNNKLRHTSSPQQNFQRQFNKQRAKIDEEDENQDSLASSNLKYNFGPEQNLFINHSSNFDGPMSLPATSYLANSFKFFDNNNNNVQGGFVNKRKQNHQLNLQQIIVDPVLTQIQMSNKSFQST